MEDNKNGISALVGQRIKQVRKEQKITIEQLAASINKSVSTVSKYESANIVLDIETLYDISVALDVDLTRLISSPPKVLKSSNVILNSPFGASQLYMYQYDGRQQRITRSVIHLNYKEESEVIDATLYMDVASFSDYSNCKYFYNGSFYSADTVYHFIFSNPFNRAMRVNICFANPYTSQHLDDSKQSGCGVLLGLSIKPFGSFASKVLISKNIQHEDETLLEQLKLSRDDMKNLKKYNLFLPE